MKHTIYTLILIFFIVGCSNNQTVVPTTDASIEKRMISCLLNDDFKLEFEVQMGTGYSWILKSSDGVIIVSKPEIKENTDKNQVGQKEKMVFVFKAIKKGIHELIFEYRQPWEKDKPAAKIMIVTVEVKS